MTGDDEFEPRGRRVRRPCSGVNRWSGYPCQAGGSVERDGKVYCYQHDPDRLKHLCSATNVQGDPCGRRGAIDRDGLLYCSFHDPAGTKKHAESLAEERAKALWAAATVRADADGVKVFLIREDVLAAVISLLAHLPYKDVNRLMRALAALPEAPVLGRERILE